MVGGGGDFRVGGAGNITTGDIQGDLRLRDTTGGQYIALQAAGATTTYTLTMPAAVGGSGQVLQTSDTSGTLAWTTISAGTPTAITVADTTDTTSYVALFESATGDLGPKTDAGITYNAGTGMLTATGFTGPLTGNASSSTPPGSDTQLFYNNGGAFGAISGVTFDDANNRLYLDTTRGIIVGSSSYANGLTVNDGAEMRGIVEFSDGSAAAPGITFWNNGDTDTGIYRVNPNIMGFAAQGDEVLTMHSASASAINYLTMTNAAAGNAPKIAGVGSDTNVGIELSVQLTEGVKFSTTTGSSDTLTIKSGRKLEWGLATAGGSDSELMGYNDTAGAARSRIVRASGLKPWRRSSAPWATVLRSARASPSTIYSGPLGSSLKRACASSS